MFGGHGEITQVIVSLKVYDETVHTHPWKFIGGARLLGLIIGRFLLR